MFDWVLKHKWMFLFKECMAGDVNLFFDDSQQEVAEIEIMIAGIIYSDFFDLRSPPGL